MNSAYAINTIQEKSLPPIDTIAKDSIIDFDNALAPKLINNGAITAIRYRNNKLIFGVRNLTLGAHTPKAKETGIRHYWRGQKIHVIINDSIYLTDNDNIINLPLTDGNYTVLAFLTYSNYESVLNPSGAMIREFTIKNGHAIKSKPIRSKAVALSSPIGKFQQKPNQPILLNFHLFNTKLSEKGDKVRLTIDNKKPILCNEWKSYLITEPTIGTHNIKIELLDKNKHCIYGPIYKQFEVIIKK